MLYCETSQVLRIVRKELRYHLTCTSRLSLSRTSSFRNCDLNNLGLLITGVIRRIMVLSTRKKYRREATIIKQNPHRKPALSQRMAETDNNSRRALNCTTFTK